MLIKRYVHLFILCPHKKTSYQSSEWFSDHLEPFCLVYFFFFGLEKRVHMYIFTETHKSIIIIIIIIILVYLLQRNCVVHSVFLSLSLYFEGFSSKFVWKKERGNIFSGYPFILNCSFRAGQTNLQLWFENMNFFFFFCRRGKFVIRWIYSQNGYRPPHRVFPLKQISSD